MSKKAKYIVGSISSGTMRERDLIPCFLDCIGQFSKRRAQQLRREFEACADDDLSEFLNETLFDTLNEYAGPFMFFGSHPGDGADYGFWLSEDWEQSLKEQDGIKVGDMGEVPKGFTGYVAQISDHGNLAMFRLVQGRAYELFSMV